MIKDISVPVWALLFLLGINVAAVTAGVAAGAEYLYTHRLRETIRIKETRTVKEIWSDHKPAETERMLIYGMYSYTCPATEDEIGHEYQTELKAAQ